MRRKFERSRTLWCEPQIVIAGGTTRAEPIRENALVIAAVMANCWEAGSAEAISTPMPSAVVSANPSNAEPVVASVRIAACSGSRQRARSLCAQQVLSTSSLPDVCVRLTVAARSAGAQGWAHLGQRRPCSKERLKPILRRDVFRAGG